MRGFAIVLVLAGCYEPTLRECTVECDDDADCGGGQVCRSDGWCAMPDEQRCEQRVQQIDAPVTPPPIDASNEACLAVCTNGDCIEGTCVIDCSLPYSCPNDVKCPPGVPCRVVCGDHACGHHVECLEATRCEVDCIGVESCHDEVKCGTAACTVRCAGSGACKRIRCASSCACDATCTGINACVDASECPDECSAGEGCTAAADCNTCGGD